MSGTISSQTQGFGALVAGQAAVIQAAAQPTAPLDFSIGSVLRALAEGTAWIGLWLQGLILQVLTLTRASTSNGPDLDSWMADFSVTRIPAVAASGAVTLARYTAGQAATVPVGTGMTTGDGTQAFAVIADPSQPSWVAVQGAYVLPIGTASASVTVQAIVAGPGGNVGAGTITLLSTPISGIDTASNPTALGGGIAAETDAALRARFAVYLTTRALSTQGALQYAIMSVPGVRSYALVQNYDTNGAYDPGSLYVVVDDGSGSPPGTLVAAVATAVAATVGAGIRFGVLGASRMTANVALSLTTAPGYDHGALTSAAQAAIVAAIDALPVGAVLSYTRLAQLAFDAGAGILNVTGLSLNGAAADLLPGGTQVVRAGSVTVT